MNKINLGGYTRISKQAARKRFHDCKATYMTPCNFRPDSQWAQPVAIPVYDTHNSFTEIVNAFEYYNCINSETGKYAAFYVKEGNE